MFNINIELAKKIIKNIEIKINSLYNKLNSNINNADYSWLSLVACL